MKVCPFCAEEIQDAALVCKHCGRDMAGGASQVQLVQPKKKTGLGTIGCLVLFVIMGIVGIAQMISGPPAPTTSGAAGVKAPAPPNRDLERNLRIKTGDRAHITGCDEQGLAVPIVNMWDDPARRTRVVGRLSGDGRKDQGLNCQGAVVIVREIRKLPEALFYRVEAVIGNQSGWVPVDFIGRKFDTAKCAAFFRSDAAAAAKCQPTTRP